jgi:hypothetical protein
LVVIHALDTQMMGGCACRVLQAFKR